MANMNCLKGMRCPECGNEEPFIIAMSCVSLVYDNGVEDPQDFKWNDTDFCHCIDCGYDGTVRDFREDSHE